MAAATPIVFDTRPEDHGSFGVLPKLSQGEYQRLADFYGLRHLTQHGYDLAKAGQYYVALWAIELKAGPAVFQPAVFNAGDNPRSDPAQGVLLWNSWPGAEPIPSEAVGPHYKSVGVHCWTDVTGSCGWGYGGGSHIGTCNTASLMASAQTRDFDLFTLAAYQPFADFSQHDAILQAVQTSVAYDPEHHELDEYKETLALVMAASGNCGVHTFWANSGGALNIVGSDALDRVGWWDDHITPNPWFVITKKAGGGGGTPTGDLSFVVMDENGVIVAHIPLIEGPPGVVVDGGFIGIYDNDTGAVIAYAKTRAGAP